METCLCFKKLEQQDYGMAGEVLLKCSESEENETKIKAFTQWNKSLVFKRAKILTKSPGLSKKLRHF